MGSSFFVIFFDTNEEKKSSRKIWKKLIVNLPETW